MDIKSYQASKNYTDKEVKTVDDRITTLTIEQQQDGEVIEARKGEVSLKAKMDSVDAQLADNTKKINHIVNVADFGVTGDGANETTGIQEAIDYVANLGGGTVQFGNKTYRAEGILPKNFVTLRGTNGTMIKLIDNPTNHLIYYYDAAELEHFNLYDLRLHGNNQIEYDVIHIDEPEPVAPSKTWYMSIVDNCVIEYGRVGVYCPVPGSVKINNSEIQYNDIGIKQLQEHFYINYSVIWGNRIGADIYGANHFGWIKTTVAHSTEVGILAAEDNWRVFQGAFIGCDFIDNNQAAFRGNYEDCRFIGCRIMNCINGIESTGLLNCTITACYFQLVTGICIQGKVGNTINGNVMHTCGTGIHVILGGSGVVSNNILRYCTEPLVIDGVDIIVTNNQITETQKAGIKLDGSTSGCTSVVISGNLIMNASKEGAGLYSGIEVHNRCNYASISNNVIRDTAARTTYAVWFADTAASIDTMVTGNVARNMLTGGYRLRAATNQANNIGTVTSI